MRGISLTLLAALTLLTNTVLAQPAYLQFTNLAGAPTTVGAAWTRVETGTLLFSTQQTSTLEVHLNARFRVGSLTGSGISFQVRLDDTLEPDFDTEASILPTEDLTQFQSILAVFQDVPAGAHAVSVWAFANGPNGAATDVMIDPGNFEGGILLKTYDGTLTAVAPPTPSELRVEQNHPNPFNPRTTIEFELTKPSPVQLRVYDVSGRLVRTLLEDSWKGAGSHSVQWNGRDDQGQSVASGVYVYQVTAGDFVSAKRMVLLK